MSDNGNSLGSSSGSSPVGAQASDQMDAHLSADTQVSANEFDIDNLPNRLTIFRILLVPVIIVCLSIRSFDIPWIVSYHQTLEWVAAWTFTVAAITDYIDGYIARKRNIITVFGSFLDPIADKFLTVSSLIMLQALGRLSALIVIILVLRELYITSLRLLASSEGLTVPVSSGGKWKTATQMIGIPMLMVSATPHGIPFYFIGKISIYIASFLSLHSCFTYSINLLRKLKQKRLEKRKAR